MNNKALCWINHQIIAADQACISVFDHGLLYGDGIFEGIRFYHGKAFQLEAHLLRLQQSASAISLTLPLTQQQIRQAIEALIQHYPSEQGYLRLVVTRGQGSLGIDPAKCAQPSLFIIADNLSVVNQRDPGQGIKLLIASIRRTPADCLDPRIKSLNYLNNILARIEANQAGMDEALMLNTQGFVTEGTVDNIFIVKNQILKTPPVSDGLLQGITRDVIIKTAAEVGLWVEEKSMTPYDVIQADECFLTGTGAELIKVSQVNQHCLQAPQDSVFNKIESAFKQLIEDECKAT